jgi:hypothetical protein
VQIKGSITSSTIASNGADCAARTWTFTRQPFQ